MSWPRTLILRAHPRARQFCPPDMIEGRWQDFQAPPHLDVPNATVKLEIVPTGQLETTNDGSAAAEVWEIRPVDV